jgi:CheY-like chemotaxis protein
MQAPRTVIIADRDRHLRNALRMQLDELGFSAFVAHDAREAVELANREVPRLVILDTDLPDLGAYETCAQIRRMPACRDVPILLVAMLDDPRIRVAAARAGGSAVLMKPFSVQDLLRGIAPFMGDDADLVASNRTRGNTGRWPDGMAEPFQHIWTTPPRPGQPRPGDPTATRSLHMLTVMRRRETGRGGSGAA